MKRSLPAAQTGMALILVLWIVAALSIFAASLGGVIRQQAAVSSVARNMVVGRAIGEAALYRVLQDLAVASQAVNERKVIDVAVQGQTVKVEVLPWSGLVNINGASPELFALLLTHAAGIPKAAADATAQAMVAARAQMRSSPAWEAPEDLLQVPGFTYAMYASLKPYVVAGRDIQGVNPMASPPLLRQWLESSASSGVLAPMLASAQYTLTAWVSFAGDGVVGVERQVSLVNAGGSKDRLPWTVLSARELWRAVGRLP